MRIGEKVEHIESWHSICTLITGFKCMHILQTSSTKTRVEPAPTWKASNANMYIVYADHNPIHWIHLSQFSDQETNPKRYFLSKVHWDSTFMVVKQNKTGWFPGESNSFFSVISRLPNLQPCKYSNYVYGKKTPAQSIINNLQFRWIIDEWSISGFHFSFPVCKYILLHTCTSIYIYIYVHSSPAQQSNVYRHVHSWLFVAFLFSLSPTRCLLLSFSCFGC